MDTMERQEIARENIAELVAHMMRSEEGRNAAKALTLFLKECYTLDNSNWKCVECLMQSFRGAYTGSVVEILEMYNQTQVKKKVKEPTA